MRAGQAFGCGQCLPCRIKVRREWSHRIMLEADCWRSSSFVTLTYKDDPQDGLMLDDYQGFLKRFRNRLLPLRLRFYGVGEYGELRGRPHYHFVFFGVPAGDVAREIIETSWDKGFVDVKPLTDVRARYIAGYVVKKMTELNDERLCGRNPEFSTKSLKPGLGFGMVPEIAATITRYNLLTPEGDVPVTLRRGDKAMPIGRYLRRALRMYLNGSLEELKSVPRGHVLRRARIYEKGKAPKIKNDKFEREMQAVRDATRVPGANPSEKFHLLRLSEGEIRSVESRFRNFMKRKDQL